MICIIGAEENTVSLVMVATVIKNFLKSMISSKESENLTMSLSRRSSLALLKP